VVAVSLGQFDGFARPLAEEIELGPAFLAAPDRLDIQNVRRMERENALYAFVIDDSTNGEGLVNPPSFPGDDRAGKDLGALLVALSDTTMNVHNVAHLEMRNLALQTLAFNAI